MFKKNDIIQYTQNVIVTNKFELYRLVATDQTNPIYVELISLGSLDMPDQRDEWPAIWYELVTSILREEKD